MLTIDVEKTDEVAVVHCGGRLVRGAEVSTLRNAVVSEKTTRIVVLDLSQVEFMDAGGLNTLVSLASLDAQPWDPAQAGESVEPGPRDDDPHSPEPRVRYLVTA